MKKALKILLWTIVSILALVLVLVLTIPLWLGSTVTAVANKVAPEYTGTPFTLDGVGINPYTGKYRVTKLNLGNPQGYPVPTAFSVSNVYVDVEMSSLFSDTIHIREITINDTYVSYVSNEGTNNFEWIGAHVESKIGAKEKPEEVARLKHFQQLVYHAVDGRSGLDHHEHLPGNSEAVRQLLQGQAGDGNQPEQEPRFGGLVPEACVV